MHFKDVGRMKESTLKRLMRLPRFDEHLECTAWTAWRPRQLETTSW